MIDATSIINLDIRSGISVSFPKTCDTASQVVVLPRMCEDDVSEYLRTNLTRTDTKLVDFVIIKTRDFDLTRGDVHTPVSEFAVQISWKRAIDGWKPIAHRDLEEKTLTAFDGEMTKADYDRLDGRCECCKATRVRKHQFLMENTETGDRVVVGGSCSKKFSGVNLVNVANAKFRLLKKIAGLLDQDEEVWRSEAHGWMPRNVYPPELILSISLWCIQKFGWLSGKEAAQCEAMTSTASYVRWFLSAIVFPRPEDRKHHYYKYLAEVIEFVSSEKAAELHGNVLGYVADQLALGWNEYMQGCQDLLFEGFVSSRAVGRLAYLPYGLQKEQLRRQRLDAQNTKAYEGPTSMHNFPGQWQIVSRKLKDSDWGSYVGITAVNPDTNEKIWFRENSKCECEVGESVKLRGKVKTVKDNMSFCSNIRTL